MREVYLKIEGRVQGIGYRRWTVAKALEIGGISGWVRNEDDGSVEILMSGDEEKIDEMIKSCYRGPIFARVDKISFLPGVSNYFLPKIPAKFPITPNETKRTLRLWLVTRVNQNALPETHRICGFRQGVFSFILYSSEQL